MKTTVTMIIIACGALASCVLQRHELQPPGAVPDNDVNKNAVNEHAAVFVAEGATYTGSTSADGQVDYFLGVPFAQAPVGDLRWTPPRPARLSGQAEVKKFGAACMQGPHLADWYKNVITSFGGDPATFTVPPVSEDCLFLNIWRPRTAATATEQAPLPVFVFIHGGSNKGGWSFEPNYHGAQLARRGVIVVTIAYRVGVFGFFAHPQLEQANFGLLDQIAALNWVQQHIGALGGDPGNVTVGGESAGANNIIYLLASPMAQGLFQRVIHQSGGSPMLNRTSRQAHAARGTQLAVQVLGAGDVDNLVALRKASAADVLAAAAQVYRGQYFDVVVDGHSVRRSVRHSVDTGAIAGVDLLIGTNADEWLMYLDPDETVDRWLADNLPQKNVQKVKAALDPNASRVQQLDTLIAGHNFVCPSLQLAAAVAQRGGRSWVYYFARQRDGERAATMGAYHGAELPYVFDTHDDWLPTNEYDHALTQIVMDYWTGFIRRGNPNGGNRPPWPAYLNSGDAVQVLDTQVVARPHGSNTLCTILQP